MRWSRWRAGRRDTRIVKAAFKEFRKTGKVIKALPEDERTVRRLHAEEVLNTTLEKLDGMKPRTVGTKHGTGTYLRPMVAAATRPAPKPQDDHAAVAGSASAEASAAFRADRSRQRRQDPRQQSRCRGWRNSISIRRRRWPMRPRSPTEQPKSWPPSASAM